MLLSVHKSNTVLVDSLTYYIILQISFFAGLYSQYGLVALISFLALDSLTKFYTTLEIELIVMLALQATTYAYRKC